MNKFVAGGVAALAALALSTGAQAATVIFDFASTPGNLGQTHTFTVSGLSLTASAFGPAKGNAANQLYGKNGGGDENGLGMTNDPAGQNEIYLGKGFIQLDISALIGKVNSIMFSMGSTTGGEQWTVYGSNTAGTIGSATLPAATALLSKTNDEGNNYTLTPGYRYYDFVSTGPADASGGGHNVLLHNVTVTPVPEPATWALMLLGFGGMGAAMRRRSRLQA